MRVRQFYGGTGAPMSVAGSPDEITAAWRSHRQRLRAWLSGLSPADWSAPTRCTEWRVTEMAQHLASGSQFLGYTLNQSRKGQASRVLEGFDAQQTAKVTAAMFDGKSAQELLDLLHGMDESVDAQIDALSDDGLLRPAEAPPGQVPAYVSINHFLFDSWVHERDLLLPANQTPVTDPLEAAMVASYASAITGVAGLVGDDEFPAVQLHVYLSDIDRHLCVEAAEGAAKSEFMDGGADANVTACVGDLVDFTTGRAVAGDLAGDDVAIAYFGRLATVMA